MFHGALVLTVSVVAQVGTASKWHADASPSYGATTAPLTTYLHHEPYYHSATASESFNRGRAAVIRSQGEFLFLRGQAAIANEQARQLAITNRVSAVQAYFQLRELNQAKRFPKRTETSQAIHTVAKRKPAAQAVIVTTSADGRIVWPALLMADAFADSREALDTLFRKRAEGLTHSELATFHVRLNAEVSKLHDALVAQVGKHRANDYLHARKFIASLRTEGTQQPLFALTAN